jgi:hypothetical protein
MAFDNWWSRLEVIFNRYDEVGEDFEAGEASKVKSQ